MKTNLRKRVFSRHALGGKRLLRLGLRSRVALGVAVVASLSCCGARAVRSETMPTINVRVINYTTATPATIAAAERGAGQIFREAGLNVIWVDCAVGGFSDPAADPCRRPLSPDDVLLRLLSDRNRAGIADDAFGFAVPPILSSVYYEHVARLAKIEGAEVTPILACVMVHEIGHLLLGPSSHSESGIMLKHWERRHAQLIRWGSLNFTPEQAKLIKAEGQRRMMLELAQLTQGDSCQGQCMVATSLSPMQ